MANKPPQTKRAAKKTAPPEADGASANSPRKQLMENEVLEHATRLFAERGFAGTSLQDVANAMGLKRPALYYYFKSKEALLDRLIVEATSSPARDLREIGAKKDLDAAARLHAMAYRIVEWVATHTDRFLLLVKSESDLSAASTHKFNEGRREAYDAVKAVIEEGVGTGQFRPVDPQIAVFGVFGICNWVAWWYQPDGAVPLESVAEQIATMAVAGVQRRSPRAGGRSVSPRAAIATLRENIDQLEQALNPPRR